MRLRRLDLIKYGHFTGQSLAFPDRPDDLHLVFGANEAGKSTSRNAFEDVLFGIEPQSSYDFLHSYKNMLIGTELERDGRTFGFRRRKGSSNTLQNFDGTLIRDATALDFFIGGIDRNHFNRLFCLNHDRLREGGRGIIEPQSDASGVIFEAGAGVSDVAEVLESLEQESRALFNPNRQARRHRLHELGEQLKSAQATLQDAVESTESWNQIRDDHDLKERKLKELRAQKAELLREQNKKQFVLKVLPHVRQRMVLGKELDEITDVVTLRGDEDERYHDARSRFAKGEGSIATLWEKADKLVAEKEALTTDDALTSRSDDIRLLNERRIELGPERDDLPKRRDDLRRLIGDLRKLAAKLGWTQSDDDALLQRVPESAQLARIDALSKQRPLLGLEIQNATSELENDQSRTRRAGQELERLGNVRDPLHILAAEKNVEILSDLVTARIESENEHFRLREQAAEQCAPLLACVSDETALTRLTVPSLELIGAHKERVAAHTVEIDNCDREINRLAQIASERCAERERITRSDSVITDLEIRKLRDRRGSSWKQIRSVLVREISLPDDGRNRLAERFEQETTAADQAADTRFADASLIAKLEEVDQAILTARSSLETKRDYRKRLEEKSLQHKAQWREMWPDIDRLPDSAAMEKWVGDHGRALETIARRNAAAQSVLELEHKETEACNHLLKDLCALGMDVSSLAHASAQGFAETARQYLSEIRVRKDRIEEKAAEKRDLEYTERATTAKLEQIQANFDEFLRTSQSEIAGLCDVPGVHLSDIVETLKELRKLKESVTDLQDLRIRKIERDITEFDNTVRQLVMDVADDLPTDDPEQCTQRLVCRLEQAQKTREAYDRLSAEIMECREQIEVAEQSRRNAKNTIKELMTLLGVSTETEITDAIERAKKAANLKNRIQELSETLAQTGGGLSLRELEALCDGVDEREFELHVDECAAQIRELDEKIEETALQYKDARSRLEQMTGGQAAAAAEFERQTTLTEIRQTAETYMIRRVAFLLCKSAIQLFLERTQAPLLLRAGHWFRELTCGSFDRLGLSYDDRNQARLYGIRPTGDEVEDANMSDGTADQLFLALRIAALEEYISHGRSFPFVADDLFVNFDDERTAAGLRVLHELSKKCQVLVFTHHQHLIDLASNVLPDTPSIVQLTNRRTLI